MKTKRKSLKDMQAPEAHTNIMKPHTNIMEQHTKLVKPHHRQVQLDSLCGQIRSPPTAPRALPLPP
jgi:hypothetical protein